MTAGLHADRTEVLAGWYAAADKRAPVHHDMTIVVLDGGKQSAARLRVRGAWPVKFEVPAFDADSSETAVEDLELAHEGVASV